MQQPYISLREQCRMRRALRERHLGPVEVNPNRDICTTNVTVIGVGGETATSYMPAMELLARNQNRLPLESIVTHRMRLEDATEAIDLAQRDGAMKVVLDPAA